MKRGYGVSQEDHVHECGVSVRHATCVCVDCGKTYPNPEFETYPEPAAAPPPAPESAEEFHKAHCGIAIPLYAVLDENRQGRQPTKEEILSKVYEFAEAYAAHLQAELAVQKEWSRKLAQDADKVAADWRAAEAQNRVLAEALRRYKHALSPWTTQYAREVTREQHLEMLAATEAAERALAPGQEEK